MSIKKFSSMLTNYNRSKVLLDELSSVYDDDTKERYLETVKEFSDMMPECRSGSLYLAVTRDGELVKIEDLQDHLYSVYDDLCKAEPQEQAGNTMIELSTGHVMVDDNSITEMTDLLRSYNTDIINNAKKIAEYTNYILERNKKGHELAKKIASLEDVLSKATEKKIDIVEEIRDVCNAMVNNDLIVLSCYSSLSGEYWITFMTKAEYMTRPDAPYMKPILVPPMLFTCNRSMTLEHISGSVNSSTHSHPHVSTGGNVCFGDESSRYETLASTRDFNGLFKLFISVIRTYNSSSPYINWVDYALAVEKFEKKRVIDKQQFLARLYNRFSKSLKMYGSNNYSFINNVSGLFTAIGVENVINQTQHDIVSALGDYFFRLKESDVDYYVERIKSSSDISYNNILSSFPVDRRKAIEFVKNTMDDGIDRYNAELALLSSFEFIRQRDAGAQLESLAKYTTDLHGE